MEGAAPLVDPVDLVDWRRRVAALYRGGDEADAVGDFRRARDQLMRDHPQSPVPAADRRAFMGLSYFAPDSAYRVTCRMEPPNTEEEIVIETGGPDGDIRYRRAGVLGFEIHGKACRLTVFSLIGYAAGLFVPFRDATSGRQTYGGGRYLFDTIKNHLPVPFPQPGVGIVQIDFNYAYNPSCAYDPHWVCPLAPRENWLEVAVEAGEKTYGPQSTL